MDTVDLSSRNAGNPTGIACRLQISVNCRAGVNSLFPLAFQQAASRAPSTDAAAITGPCGGEPIELEPVYQSQSRSGAMETFSNQSPRPGESTSEDRTGEAGLARDIKQQAGEITEQAKSKAKSKAREAAQSGQELAAEQLDQFADGVRRSAESWEDSQHAWVKQALANAADGIERVSTTLRERDISSLLSEAEETARRHPAIFAAGCAVAGFALVRFLKSSGRSSSRGAYDRMDAGAGYDERSSRSSAMAGSAGYGNQSGYSSNI